MTLSEALKLLGPAVGDGKVIQAHAYVFHKAGVLHVTNGKQWASIPIDVFEAATTPNFCVRYDALVRATSREGAQITIAGDDVVVRYRPRGRIVLRPLADDMWPEIEPIPDVECYAGTGLKPLMATLVKFAGTPDSQVWSQAVHLTPDFAFAANNRAGARGPHAINLPRNFTIPIWTAQMIAAQDENPTDMWEEEQFLGFRWSNGLVVRTRLLNEDAPEPVMTLMSNLPLAIATEVPEGMKEAVSRLKEHGAVNYRMGEGKAFYHTQAIEVDEEVDVPGRIRLWNTDTSLAALELATHLDLSGEHGKWVGNGYAGIFTGMHGE